jgi:anti-sigma B factor antagonist
VEAIEERPEDSAAVVQLAGELDVAEPEWADAIDDVLDAGRRRVVIDLTNVTFIDSSVVRALLLAHRRIGADGWLRLVYTHHLIARVIEICGLADTFPQYATVESAVRSAPTRAAAATLRAEVASGRAGGAPRSLSTQDVSGERHDAE